MPADILPPRPASAFDSFMRGLRLGLGPIASLKITVVLFVLSALLVFFGTLAQKGQGVWTVVDSYFYSWFVKVEVKYLVEFAKVFIPGTRADATSDWWFPFPAGKLIGWAMVINLLAAHTIQFFAIFDGARKQAARSRSTAAEVMLVLLKRSGIFVLHGGVLVMLLGEYVTREFAVEQQMRITEGESANYAFEIRNCELAFVDGSDPAFDRVAVLPGRKMKQAVEARDQARKYNLPAPSTRFSHPDLPVDVEVVAYYTNATLKDIDRELTAAVLRCGPEAAAGKPTDEQRAATADLADVVDRYKAAVKAAPDDAPLPLFEKALEQTPADRFRSPAGQAARAKLDIEIGRLKEAQQATAGEGLRTLIVSAPEASGVDDAKVDWPAAYVNLIEKTSGNSLGVYAVSTQLSFVGEAGQKLPGVAATAELRHTRHYKAYTLHLNDVKADHYVGTNIPKNYSSDVRLVDAGLNQDRLVTIRMNEPLRHRGDAIFQSSVSQDAAGDTSVTGLQVVSNIGWTLPYISCVLVMLGMGVHFVIKLIQFLARAMSGAKATAGQVAKAAGIDLTARTQPPLARFGVPVAAAVIALLFLFGLSWPRKPTREKLDLQPLATLPVVDRGRVKPLDTVARVYLRQITHAEEYTDAKGVKRPALAWFMDTASADPEASEGIAAATIFRVENDQVRDLLKLPRREGLRYSANDIRAGKQFANFLTEYKKADAQRDTDEKSLNLYQSKVLELGDHIKLSQGVMFGEGPLMVPPDGDQEWQSPAAAARAAGPHRQAAFERAFAQMQKRAGEAGLPADLSELKMGQLSEVQQEVLTRIGREERDKAEADMPHSARVSVAWERVLSTYREGEAKPFDEAVQKYRALVLEKVPEADVRRVEMETSLNQSARYYWCTVLYALAGAAGLIGFVLLLVAPKASREVRRGIFWVLVVTFLVHTATLLARMYLMERPLVFVTNLYSSAVFIGWGIVALGLILELVYPIGFGNVVASVLGFGTCIIAHNLAASGDTLEMMRAVLDTNFWLATHVTTVTLGYSATYVAGLLGLIYIVLYVLPEKAVLRQKVTVGSGLHQMSTDVGKILGSLVYAVVCFATLLSFVGTVLGGIWADQSWGRFWGWDPKENGAVLIVLWNALILHARWGGMVKERGLAVLSVGGIIITTWSWFGTNQLGVGLHAYGFNNGLVMLCDGVWLGAIAAVLVGVMPWQWVYRGGTPAPAVPPQAKRA